jgi:hypothetical protein
LKPLSVRLKRVIRDKIKTIHGERRRVRQKIAQHKNWLIETRRSMLTLHRKGVLSTTQIAQFEAAADPIKQQVQRTIHILESEAQDREQQIRKLVRLLRPPKKS